MFVPVGSLAQHLLPPLALRLLFLLDAFRDAVDVRSLIPKLCHCAIGSFVPLRVPLFSTLSCRGVLFAYQTHAGVSRTDHYSIRGATQDVRVFTTVNKRFL